MYAYIYIYIYIYQDIWPKQLIGHGMLTAEGTQCHIHMNVVMSMFVEHKIDPNFKPKLRVTSVKDCRAKTESCDLHRAVGM